MWWSFKSWFWKIPPTFTYICTFGFGFGIRPKARCFSDQIFGFGLKWKTYFRSFTDTHYWTQTNYGAGHTTHPRIWLSCYPIIKRNRNGLDFRSAELSNLISKGFSWLELGLSLHHKAFAASWHCQWTREVFKIPKNISQWKTKLAVVRRLKMYLVIFNG